MLYLKTSTDDLSLGAIIILKNRFHISTFAIRTPIGLLRVIWLQGKLPFHLKGDNQVRAWIRIRLTGLSKLDVARHSWIELLRFQKLKKKTIKVSVEFTDFTFKNLI